MMRFSAETLDLSRFPAPLAIRDINFEADLATRLAALAAAFNAAGIPFDVERLVANPAAFIERVDNYRETLVKGSINDALRAVMVAFAVGSDLDHLALPWITRRVITPATNGAPAVMESDAEFRRRVLLIPEAFSSAGAHGAYVFHALSADPRVLNVDVWSPSPGVVNVAVQSREGDGTATADLVAAVRAYLYRPDIKPRTDVVNVFSITNVPYTIDVEGFCLPGPDPLSVKASMIEALSAMAAARRTPARDVPRSAVFAAAQVGPLDKAIVNSPLTDIARGYGEVAVLTAIDVTVSTYGG